MGYWRKAFSRIVSQTVSEARERDTRFLKEWLSFGFTYEATPKAPTEQLFELYPEAEGMPVEMGMVRYRRSNINPFELFCLKAVTALIQPRRIFEIGTFDGATSLELARSATQADIFTLDLSPSDPALASADDEEADHVKSGGVGQCFAETTEATRITQLLGDSRYYDYSPYLGSMDLVFVDACHLYEFAVADSATALRLCAPGGIVIWHDYQPGWPGVVRAVDELTAGQDVRHLAGTDFAILRIPERA